MAADHDARFKLRAGTTPWRELDEEAVVLDLRSSQYLAANPAGTVLWRLLARGATRGELAAALVETYEIAPERAEADVESFLADLERRSLIETTQP